MTGQHEPLLKPEVKLGASEDKSEQTISPLKHSTGYICVFIFKLELMQEQVDMSTV